MSWTKRRPLSTYRCFTFLILLIALGSLRGPSPAEGQQARKHIALPEIPGYLTLTADLHLHTIFSDGQVLPSTRVVEAWREGLDIISITDHDTSDPEHIVGDKSKPYEMALRAADQYGIMLIKGSEITRFQRPDRVGHFNALFVPEPNRIVGKDYFEAIQDVVNQGGFVFLNHPSESWNSHLWKEEFQRLESHGLIHGVEVVNGGRYYENAQTWCNEKGLTPIATSDLHAPSHYSYGYNPAGHRPMTLIFVSERSQESVKEALFAGRTVAYTGHALYGDAEYLRPLFEASIQVQSDPPTIVGTGSTNLIVRNLSDVDLVLSPPDDEGGGWVSVDGDEELEARASVTFPAQRIAHLVIRNPRDEEKEGLFSVRLRYRVSNFVVAPDMALEVEMPVTVRVRAESTGREPISDPGNHQPSAQGTSGDR